jgi:predicted nucleic acid-binding protein
LRVVLDVNILVRANDRATGLARDLFRELLRRWIEAGIYDYIQFLRQAAETVVPDTSLAVPIRDPADLAIVQTAIAGDAEFICTMDPDFYEPAITDFLGKLGIKVLDGVALMQVLRASDTEERS